MNSNKLPSHYLIFHTFQHILCLCGNHDSSGQWLCYGLDNQWIRVQL